MVELYTIHVSLAYVASVLRGRAKAEKLATCFEFELDGKFTMKKEIELVSPASYLFREDRVHKAHLRTAAQPAGGRGRTLLCNAHSLPV